MTGRALSRPPNRTVVERIDEDGDGEISEQELLTWIKKARDTNTYINLKEELQRQWQVRFISSLFLALDYIDPRWLLVFPILSSLQRWGAFCDADITAAGFRA